MDRVTGTPQVTDNQAASRFEVTVDGHLAELTYRRHGQRFVLIHTGVPPELEGRGLGSALVAAAAGQAAREGLTVVPLCSFARNWLTRHADIAATLTIDWSGGER
jgi:predicted GNAT family acetyltransferase